MKKKVLFLLLSVMLIGVSVFSGCSGTSSTPDTNNSPTALSTNSSEKPITLKYASYNNENHGWMQAILRWQKTVTDESDGKIVFENYFSGTLIGSQNAVREIAAGVADLGAGYISLQKSGFELSNGVRAWMYGCTDIHQAVRVDKELFNTFPEIRKEYEGVKVLGGWSNPGLYWISSPSKAIRSVDDMKGLTIKASSWVAQLQAIGCAPASVPMTETYIAMQKGMIDSVLAPMETMFGYKLAEVTKYHTSIGLAQGSQPELLFNLNRWNSLPPDVQQILEKNIPYCEEELAKEVTAMEAEGIEECKKHEGHEFITMPQDELGKFYEIMDSVSKQEAAALDAKGYPGTKLFNEARRLIELDGE